MASQGNNTSTGLIEENLCTALKKIERTFDANVLTFVGGIVSGADEAIRDAIEERARPRKRKLIVILETSGGYIDMTQRIAETFRKHYRVVEFVIPNYAMSAGTVLVMSGDAIHMDYFSCLGPIDPQVKRPSGDGLMPALGYLKEYERLIKKAEDGKLTTAEITYLVQKFNPAELYQYKQARALSIALLKEWLVKYKFRNWKRTRTRRLRVTKKMKVERAEKIGEILNDTDRWNSHGRGISLHILRRDLKLEIEDFEQEERHNSCIRPYYKLLTDYMAARQHRGALHTAKQYIPLRG